MEQKTRIKGNVQYVGVNAVSYTHLAGADIAGYHKGCCTFSPAFSHVRTTTAAANGMQTVTFYNTLCFCVTFIGADTYLQPFGLSHWMYDLWFESYDL